MRTFLLCNNLIFIHHLNMFFLLNVAVFYFKDRKLFICDRRFM